MDNRAVLTWLGRAYLNFHDISIAHALDILVCCIQRSEENYCESKNINSWNNDNPDNNNNNNNNNDNNNDNNDNDNNDVNNNKNNNNNSSISNRFDIRNEKSIKESQHTSLPHDVEKEEMNFLLTTADACLSRMSGMKGLVLSNDTVHNTNIADTTTSFFATVPVGSGIMYPVYGKNIPDAQEGSELGLVWNVLSVSTNMIQLTGGEKNSRAERTHTGVGDSNDMTNTVYSAFWVLQRSAALHATLCRSRSRRSSQECPVRGSVSSSSRGRGRGRVHDKHTMPMHDTCSSVRMLLSLSELDVPDKNPWMAGTDSEPAVRTGAGTGVELPGCTVAHMRDDSSVEQIIRSNSCSSSSNNNRSTRSTAAARSSPHNTHTSTSPTPDSSYHKYFPFRDGMCVWACGAGDGIEGIMFTRYQGLTVTTAIRYITLLLL